MANFTIGSDVEFFLKNKKQFVSAIPFVGNETEGTKHNPIVFEDESTLQRDNVAVEFATAVAGSEANFVQVFKSALHHLMYSLKDTGLKVLATPSVDFTPDQLNHWEAKEFGCDPDFNAWKGGKVNPKPCAINKTLRTAALHIHVGNALLKNKNNKLRMVKTMDAIHGIVGTMLDNSPESLRRKELYGKAGAYRKPSYGVEYRVLSNFFASSPTLVKMLYKLTGDALKLVEEQKEEALFRSLGGEAEICGIINSGNDKLAFRKFVEDIRNFISIDSSNLVMDIFNTKSKIKGLKEEWNV